MLTRPLLAFDIETVPDPDFGRRVMGLDGDNAAVIEAMTTQRLEETEGRTQYPAPPLHRIVCRRSTAPMGTGSGTTTRVVITTCTSTWWCVQRGDLEGPRLIELVEVIRTALAEEPFSGWREIADGLEKWPAGQDPI